MPYYEQTSLVSRLRDDVILPEKARGATEVWLAGISLGGWDPSSTPGNTPKTSPGSSPGPLPRRGRTSGGYPFRRGLAQMEPRAGAPGKGNVPDLWGWLKISTLPRSTAPAIYLGYGTHDRYAVAHELLATALPPERVPHRGRGHDWRTWERLWGTMARLCASARPSRTPPGTAQPRAPALTQWSANALHLAP